MTFDNPDKGAEAHCSANDPWLSADVHDCRCQVHLGAQAFKEVHCYIQVIEEETR